jgi:opacity protein-like surface antigen
MKLNIKHSILLLILNIWFLVPNQLYAEDWSYEDDADSSNDEWRFEITPYLFAAGLDGTVEMRGVPVDVDMSFSDVWERLDKAFMLYSTARKGDWVYALDIFYFSMDDEKASSWQGPLGGSNTAQLNVDVTQQVYALSVGYRILNEKTKVDLLALARYTSLDTTMQLALTTGSDLLPDGSRSVSREEDWWDAGVAIAVLVPIAKKWDFLGHADIAAGGSDLSYQLLAGVNWQFSHTLSVKFGYRYFYQDYQKDDFKWDMATSGAFAGLGIKF